MRHPCASSLAVCALAVLSIASFACGGGGESSGPPANDATSESSTGDALGPDGSSDASGDAPPAGRCATGVTKASPPAKCSIVGAGCSEGDACCVCGVFLSCGSEPIWACGSTAGDKCPALPTKIGDACPTEGQRCTYCNTGTLTFRSCISSKWTDDSGFGCR